MKATPEAKTAVPTQQTDLLAGDRDDRQSDGGQHERGARESGRADLVRELHEDDPQADDDQGVDGQRETGAIEAERRSRAAG